MIFISKIGLHLTLSFLYFNFFCLEPVEGQNINKNLTERNIAEQISYEKVYLHLDRTHYQAGEDIWFKAYLADATTNRLTSSDNCLHVELYSSSAKIIKKETILLTNGTGNGDFSLDEDLPGGTYFIRAYTNWMRNFGELFFFTKAIDISNHFVTEKITESRTDTNSQKTDLQFMPEGGSLVEDVLSDIGFKAIDYKGHGCDVKGFVISSVQDTIVSFTSTHLGMGRFSFIPKSGLSYYAIWTAENRYKYTVQLPLVKETGYSLHVTDENANYFKVVIRTNIKSLKNKPNRTMYISCVTRNNLCLAGQIPADTTINIIFISKKNFPEGITDIKLFGSDLTPQCERLFYVHKKESIHLEVKSDKVEYDPKEKTDLTIAIKDSVSNDVRATLSMAVTEKNENRDNIYNSNICSSFLLESDIRGMIEQAGYYFDPNQCDRFTSLDLLLLTQGWRNFIWKQLPDSLARINYPIERGMSVSGRLRQILMNKSIPSAVITMVLLDSINAPILQYTTTNQQGKFLFEGLLFNGMRKLIVSALDDKIRKRGLLQLDSMSTEKMESKISFNDRLFTPISIFQEQIDEAFLSGQNVKPIIESKKYNEKDTTSNGQAVMKPLRKKKFSLRDTTAIDQVEVHAKKSFMLDDGRYRMYGGIPAQVIEDPSEIQEFLSLVGMNLGNGFKRMSNRPSPMDKKGKTLILVDGMEVPLDLLWLMIPSEILRIELLTRSEAIIFGPGVTNVISIFSKKVTPLDNQIRPYVVKKDIMGYYQSRAFYSPLFGGKDILDPRASTILWAANIITDSSGKAKISFCNKKKKAIIYVQVEGITMNGAPITGKIKYQVK
jgi:hypothetical protein